MIPLDLNQIQAHLQKQEIHAELQKETNQLCILLKIGEREYPLFIRIYEGGDLLQLLAFLPTTTKKPALGDIARLLHLLNKEIDLPGFGMDETNELVFYRCMIPVRNKEIDETLLTSFIQATETVCQSFAAVIAGVAYGAVSFEDVMKQSKKHSKDSFSQSILNKE